MSPYPLVGLLSELIVTLCPAVIVKVSPSAGVDPPQVEELVQLPDCDEVSAAMLY